MKNHYYFYPYGGKPLGPANAHDPKAEALSLSEAASEAPYQPAEPESDFTPEQVEKMKKDVQELIKKFINKPPPGNGQINITMAPYSPLLDSLDAAPPASSL